ncbi:G2 and S phase-expressed protein 1 isoform X2 [Antennarius striatus]|uniref:G2 and S phase-expressed protein 1 isoform X2 n=1 Tax=Antennarius striatus TaxID=241820 RepID=UPI0035B190EB
MDRRANSDDLCFLPDEKFDFDVSLSPASFKGDEDEDEVFVGPVGHKESCVSVGVASWSQLTGDQLEFVCQEAQRLANQLQNGELRRDEAAAHKAIDITAEGEEFVQDSDAKLHALCPSAAAVSPIKRQTFCVQDSPLKQLPPAVQQRLLRTHSARTAPPVRPANGASSTRPANGASSTRPANGAPSTRPANGAPSSRRSSSTSFARPAASSRLNTSSPMAAVRAGLRGKATLGVGAVLPNRPTAPTTSCLDGRSTAEKTRLQPPNRVGGVRRRSPASRPSGRAESSEEPVSDSASVASDISDSSLNSSVQGKHALAPPTQAAGRKLSGVKTPVLQGRRVTDRKNTSSSSSSMSSFNSSMSVSPAKGKLNSSLSASVGPAPSSVSRPVNGPRPRRSALDSTSDPACSASSRRSLSAQVRKTHEVERVKAVKATPLKRAEATPLQPTSAKKAVIPSSASSRPQVALKVKSKPEALITPTAAGADDASKMVKPKRLMSAGSVDRFPQKSSSGPLTPSSGSCRSLQVRPRRPSALPTPVKRRMSSIPVATPTKQIQPLAARTSPGADSTPGSALTRRQRSLSPAPTGSQEVEPIDAPDIQPFCLEEEEEPPAAPPCSPTQPEELEEKNSGTGGQEEVESNKNLMELEPVEDSNKTHEVLLLDLPAPALQPQEKLLIDLTNTPDLIRTSNKSCTSSQLIDLSSPLIKWSPEDRRENVAPLINLSF